MKREEYNGKFDQFEAPPGMWDKIEAGLDTKKKKRGIIWWPIAATLAVIAGVSIYFAQMNVVEKPQTNVAEVSYSSREKQPTEKVLDTLPASTDSANLTITVGNTDTYFEVKEKPADPPRLTTTAIPFLDLSGSTTTYNWTTAIGNVTATGASSNVYSSYSLSPSTSNINLSVSNIEPASIQRIPSTGAEADIVTAFSVMPGVKNSRKLFGKKRRKNKQPNALINSNDQSGLLNNSNQESTFIFEPLRDANNLWRINTDETTNTTHYDAFQENRFLNVNEEPLSTFSIDVDGASYSDVRGQINRNELPNPDAVRIEEFINYFPYDYTAPEDDEAFAINSEVGDCPWNPAHQLMKVAIKGKEIEKDNLPTNNLVFLIDVSGSMNSPEKLEIIQKGFRLLVNELREEDHVSICVYASASGVVLEPTSGQNKDQILDAIMNLSAGGSTAGGQGIKLAYSLASENFDEEGNNRIILATDGDFNVGMTNDDDLIKLIEEKRESGVFLTVLGVGHNNYQSSKMEKLANNGNGNFSYIDNILEAKKVLVTEMGGTLQTIAKDVKIQMEFNPTLVSSYRLIGYENRMLKNEDFSNDKIDAGELGTGHTVTAIYEIIPAGTEVESESNPDKGLKYSKVKFEENKSYSNEMAVMKFRYKRPKEFKSILIEEVIYAKSAEEESSIDFMFSQAVVEFGLILRQSEFMASSSFESVMENAGKGLGDDPFGYRREFMSLVEKTKLLWSELDSAD